MTATKNTVRIGLSNDRLYRAIDECDQTIRNLTKMAAIDRSKGRGMSADQRSKAADRWVEHRAALRAEAEMRGLDWRRALRFA